ncbi:hypothetical protein L1987_48724 [Smallanthus sonchifolius]|uniref:Uncharacterized protein n=1 Tax=Smallanthus sonchifolius TaxID=185202 RepID=A0ACB9FSH8_9ASTR|nr:hypothetical protein L1987_48724 [Smallanthus sonchifolius]
MFQVMYHPEQLHMMFIMPGDYRLSEIPSHFTIDDSLIENILDYTVYGEADQTPPTFLSSPPMPPTDETPPEVVSSSSCVDVTTPKKKQFLESKSGFCCEKSLLEALPQEILALIAKNWHFDYMTPKKIRVFRCSLNLEELP